MAYLPEALLKTVLTGLQKKTNEEADSSQKTVSKVALEAVLNGSEKPVNMETDPLSKTSSEAAVEAVSSGSQKRGIEESIQKNEAKRVKTDRFNVWRHSGHNGTYVRITKNYRFLSFPMTQSCKVVKDIARFWMITRQHYIPLLDALARMIDILEDSYGQKHDWDDAIARTLHLGMMQFPSVDSIFGDSTLDKLATLEYDSMIAETIKSELVSVWFRNEKDGPDMWMKQRQHKMNFPIRQSCDLMPEIVQEWTYCNSDYRPMLRALTEIFIIMITHYHEEKNWKIDQYRVLQKGIHCDDLADLDESENSLLDFCEAVKLHKDISGGDELDSQNLSADLAKYYRERDSKEMGKNKKL